MWCTNYFGQCEPSLNFNETDAPVLWSFPALYVEPVAKPF